MCPIKTSQQTHTTIICAHAPWRESQKAKVYWAREGGRCVTSLLSGTSSFYQADRHHRGPLLITLHNQPKIGVCMCEGSNSEGRREKRKWQWANESVPIVPFKARSTLLMVQLKTLKKKRIKHISLCLTYTEKYVFHFAPGELPWLHPDTTSVKITDPWSDWMTLQSSSIQNLQDNVIKKYSPFEMKPKLICQVEIQVFSGTYPITVIHLVGSACVSAYTIRPKPLLV